MNQKLRIVKDAETESLIYNQKVLSANRDYKFLVVQSLAFGCFKEYSELVSINVKFSQTRDVDSYINSLNNHKHLYELGIPSKEKLALIKQIFAHIRAESKTNYANQEELDCRNLLSRILVRAVIFKKDQVLPELFLIGNTFRTHRNVLYFKSAIRPYLSLIERVDAQSK